MCVSLCVCVLDLHLNLCCTSVAHAHNTEMRTPCIPNRCCGALCYDALSAFASHRIALHILLLFFPTLTETKSNHVDMFFFVKFFFAPSSHSLHNFDCVYISEIRESDFCLSNIYWNAHVFNSTITNHHERRRGKAERKIFQSLQRVTITDDDANDNGSRLYKCFFCAFFSILNL